LPFLVLFAHISSATRSRQFLTYLSYFSTLNKTIKIIQKKIQNYENVVHSNKLFFTSHHPNC